MEENKNKKPDEVEEPKPAEEPAESSAPSPEEPKGEEGFKAKLGAFFSVKRNKIIVGACSAAAVAALIIGLSVGLTQCSNNGSNGGTTSSSSSSKSSSDDDGSSSKGGSSSSSKDSGSSSSSDGDKSSSEDGGSSSKGGSSSSSEEDSSSAHTHDYGTAWKSDATKHWHECACGEKSGEAEHTFSTEKVVITKATPTASGTKGYKCAVCDYAKDLVSYNPYINSSNFDAALVYDGDKFTTTYQKSGKPTETMVKNGDAIYWKNSNGEEEYYSKVTEGSSTKYYNFAKDSSGAWIKTEIDNESWDTYSVYNVNGDYFDEKLSYQGLSQLDETKDCYTMSYTDDHGVSVSAELYFESARLVKGIKTYSDTTETYTFSDNADEITLPANAHMHTYSDAGSLDLNQSSPKFVTPCTGEGCTAKETRELGLTDIVESVFYGYYPQTHVGDSTIINKLASATRDATTGWYLLDGTYYAKATAGSTTAKFDDGTPIASETEYWFKVEPIEWNVLISGSGTYSLLSKTLLDVQIFDDSANTYATSSIRTWLTGDFLSKAFSSGSNLLQDLDGDKVYLLSESDLNNYLPSLALRKCLTTDWARANGAFASGDNYGEYWSSTADSTAGKALLTDQSGQSDLPEEVNYTKACARPAITVTVS